MRRVFLITIFVIFLPQTFSVLPPFDFVIWNVGQGLWTSFLFEGKCYHIDMGGESFPSPVIKLCRKKKNFLLLTHEDWDHVRFISTFKKQVRSFCLHVVKAYKSRYLNSIKKCNSPLPRSIKIISRGDKEGSENERSIIYLVKNQILVPGDTTKKEERKWTHKLPHNLRFLVLAHHGSDTSSSSLLLSHVNFKMAIASARKKRYGHPHWRVKNRLRKANISLLRTEQMGHLYLQLPKN